MASATTPIKLSICIATFNRAIFIGPLLESIISQATKDCEIVISDDASTDDTKRVVTEYARRFNGVRYVRQASNIGLDRNFDRVVELACGEYCWLMADDDLLKPGAVLAVLQALRRDLSLVIVNTELRTCDMSNIVESRVLKLESDRLYRREEMDRLFSDTAPLIRFIGCLVVKRAVWLARDRERYYGSIYIHLGVIFQEPLPGDTLVIAKPFISYRMGNIQFSKWFEIVMFKLPSTVWSLSLSDSAKRSVCSQEPWREFQELLHLRGQGFYSLTEYRHWVRPRLLSIRERLAPALAALLPGMLVNSFFMLYYALTRGHLWAGELQTMKYSRFHVRNWQVLRKPSLRPRHWRNGRIERV